MKPYIKSTNYTSHSLKNQEAVKQPLGIDYEQLTSLMTKTSSDKQASSVQDMRKLSKQKDVAKELEENDVINKIEKSSVIPVPGLAVEYENSGSQDRPPDSDWIAPHGPDWNPMTM